VTINKTWKGPLPIGRNQPPEKNEVPVTWQYQAVTNVPAAKIAKLTWTTTPPAANSNQLNRVLTNQYMRPDDYVITVTIRTTDGAECFARAFTPLTGWPTAIRVLRSRTGLYVQTIPKQVKGQKIWANCGIWHTVNGKPQQLGKSRSFPITSTTTGIIPVQGLRNGTWTLVCYINNREIASQQEAAQTAYGKASLTFQVVNGTITKVQ
jgi:hypothetical protein